MLERLAVLLAFGVLVAIVVLAVREKNRRRVRQVLAASNVNPLWSSLGETPDGRPTLVTFSTPSCPTCHHAQAPAANLFEQRLGASEIRVFPIDAAQQPEIAGACGVQPCPGPAAPCPIGLPPAPLFK